MSRAFKILSPSEQIIFDAPPQFNASARKKYFRINSSLESLIRTKIRTHTNRVMFVITYGYFYSCKQFFGDYNRKDINYVCGQYGINPNKIKFENYKNDAIKLHRKLILEYFGFQPFDAKARTLCRKEAKLAARSQMKPRNLVHQMVEMLIKNSFQVPAYNAIAKIISSEYNAHKSTLVQRVNKLLQARDKQLLQKLLTKNQDSDVARYDLTLLKRFSQSMRPRKIQQNVEDLKTLKELYKIAAPVISHLDLNNEGIRHYAEFAKKSEIFQLTRRKEKDRNLHLVAFIAHHYFRLQDLLVDGFLASTTSAKNAAEKEYKENYYTNRKLRAENVNRLANYADLWIVNHEKCRQVLLNEKFTCDVKVDKLFKLYGLVEQERESIVKVVENVRNDTQMTLNEEGLLQILESNSRKLQNRVSDIMKNLTFVCSRSSHPLYRAILSYQRTNGRIPENSPLGFLTTKQRGLIKDNDGKIRKSLYKALLFLSTADTIKSGEINIEHSYKYRALEEYLIPLSIWKKNKENLLHQLNMTNYIDFSVVSADLGKELESEYYNTNTHILNNENDHVKPDGLGGFRLSAARYELDKESLPAPELFPKNECISLSEVLATVNRPTQFSKEFHHTNTKNIRKKPSDHLFFAGIIGYGCQIGTSRIAQISKNINEKSLEQSVKWYFSLENLQQASDRVLDFIDKMDLPKIYQDDPNVLHTSSDGQKYEVTEESLNAAYSFKYLGKSKGISEYTHIDARHRFFHSETITSSERESHYVIDGLMHNDVVKSDIHSTDTHGFSEAIFGVMYLLGFTFAPRIKNIHKKTLYALKTRRHYKGKKYDILPDKKIDMTLIEENWDDILRFGATIKAKETTASQLFRRLNSYSQGNPLYEALKEFGRILKTIFILKYIDDPELREAIHRQLNKSESGNKLSRAISIGSPDFNQASKEEQEIAENCKRLIKNAIVCWNYMYLTQELANEPNPEKKKELITKFKRGSVVSWPHFNFHGEFDFSDEKLEDSIGFNISQILKEKLSEDEPE